MSNYVKNDRSVTIATKVRMHVDTYKRINVPTQNAIGADMSNTKTATLSGLLVAKKGSDAPRPEHPGLEEAQTPSAVHMIERKYSSEASENTQGAYYKSLTLKVDKDRFTKLKNLGVQRDLRSQALMTEALDLLFTKHNL